MAGDSPPIRLRPLAATDLDSVAAILVAADLPVDDVADNSGGAFVVAERDGVLVGIAGLETHDRYALLRSVAVGPSAGLMGVGSQLVWNLLAASDTAGGVAVYLLTTTAADYFGRFGFEPVDRADAPDAIRTSREFAQLCPATATLMRRLPDSPRTGGQDD